MSVHSGTDANGINGDYTRINWHPPGTERDDGVSSKNATLALKTAIAVARAFDANCALRNPAKEGTIPMFESQELIIGEAFRNSGFFEDLALRGIKLTRNLQHGEFSEEEEEYRERFAERSIDGHYCVKFLQKGLYNSVHAASAASDMMMETKILMNLAPHPNICQIYGVTAAGSDAFLSRGKEGFYIILDRLSGTMTQKLDTWREEQEKDINSRKAKGDDESTIALEQYKKRMQRLEVALDVGSALLFLSDRQMVFHLRPEKIGFDVRYGRIKLVDFGQARENGQLDQAPSLTKTDDIRTLAYVAPEVLCQAPVTVAADVYAFGVVLWEMLSLERPFDRLSRSDHFEKIVMNGERPPMAPTIPKAVQSLIETCWDPHLRPTMKKVYDTVEEILLFQDDKPEIPALPVLAKPPLENAPLSKTGTQVISSSPVARAPRTLRRTKTEEKPYSGRSKQEKPPDENRRRRRHHNEEKGPMKDKSSKGSSNHGGESSGRVSRKNRQHRSSTTHEKGSKEGMKDKSMKDKSMKDESRENADSTPMKDKTKQRSSRRSRASSVKKLATEETTEGSKISTAEAEVSNGDDKISKDSKGKEMKPPESLPTTAADEDPSDAKETADQTEPTLGNSQGSSRRSRRKSSS